MSPECIRRVSVSDTCRTPVCHLRRGVRASLHYYYEPGTGRQFRSLVAVERYLEEMGDENAPLSHVFKLGCHVKNSGPRKKICREEVKTSTFDSDIPPAKVNWVLADSGGDTWNAFMGESVVPESVTQQWANRFMLSINDNNFAAPNFEW
ncbi:hypothetical protein CsSME_00016431 [Camellia sinensis var. sinensis]